MFMKIIRINYKVRGFTSAYNSALKHSMTTKEAEHKMKVLIFLDKHGMSATIDAFNHGRSTILLWKKIFKDNNQNIESLNNKSRAPRSTRKRNIDKSIESFIINIRSDHPRIGKDKIEPLLSKYCLKNNVKMISNSTIGRIIDDLKKQGKIPEQIKLSLNGKTGRLIERKKPKKQKKLRRKGYLPKCQGDLIEVDTITYFINGVKRYIITAIDLYSDFSFSYAYKSLSSTSASDFMFKLKLIAPFKINRVQTDNGLEFHKHFHDYLNKRDVTHYYTYPRSPKMNGHIERFNRTLKEEFSNYKKHTLAYDINEFNKLLMDYLLWYNLERPHYALAQVSPMEYICNKIKDKQKSNMLWTHTKN